MSKKKKAIAGAFALGAVTIAGAYTLNTANAQQQQATNYPTIVDKLVERFNLNKDDVQKVFDENRNERRTQAQERFNERLDQAIADGKLTEEQKQAILDKKTELQNEWQQMQGLSWDERKQKMQEHQDEMKNWLNEQNIDPSVFGGGMRGGFGHMGIRDNK